MNENEMIMKKMSNDNINNEKWKNDEERKMKWNNEKWNEILMIMIMMKKWK